MKRCAVDRWACVDLPALPLQHLLRRHPEWRGRPAVVVESDSPTAPILWLNEAARRRGVLPGLRYNAALSLCPELEAGCVSPEALEAEVEALCELLRDFSPEVEAAPELPGIFWLDATGLGVLWPDEASWAAALVEALSQAGRWGAVVIAPDRFSAYALARVERGGGRARVLRSPETAQRLADRVPLSRLHLPPALRDALARLGVLRVGALRGLPGGSLQRRYGPEAEAWRRWACGELWRPIQGVEGPAPAQAELELDPPDDDVHRLLFGLKAPLEALLEGLARRHQLLTRLHLRCRLEGGAAPVEASLEPAEPTLELRQLLDLLRLKLGALSFEAPVEAVRLEADHQRARPGQIELFIGSRRELGAARRALARVRAELGPEQVVVAELAEGHLPEARYRWRPLGRLEAPVLAAPEALLREGPRLELALARLRPLVRRALGKATSLRPGPAAVAEAEAPLRAQAIAGWRPLGPGGGEAQVLAGPFDLSGGWWQGEVRRRYYFLQLSGGALLWVYYDARRGRWRQQGAVE